MKSDKPIRINEEVWELIGEAGSFRDTYNTALKKALEVQIDVKRCLYGAEPLTEELRKLKGMWCK